MQDHSDGSQVDWIVLGFQTSYFQTFAHPNCLKSPNNQIIVLLPFSFLLCYGSFQVLLHLFVFNPKSPWLLKQYQRTSERVVHGFLIDTSQFLERHLLVHSFKLAYLLVHSFLYAALHISLSQGGSSYDCLKQFFFICYIF